MNLLQLIKKLYLLFTPKERRQFFCLLPGIVLMGILNIVGVAFVVPFMAVVVKPELIQTSKTFRYIYQYFHFSSMNHFFIFLGVIVLVALVLGDIFSMLMYWLMTRFTCNSAAFFSIRLFSYYLDQPYVFFLNHNSADLLNEVINEVNSVLNFVLNPLIQMIANVIGICFVLILLLMADLKMSLSLCGILLIIFLISTLITRSRLLYFGSERRNDLRQESRILIETFGGIKETKLLKKEEEFVERFKAPALRLAYNTAAVGIIGIIPRYMLEILAFGGMIVVTLFFLISGKPFAQIVSLLVLYAVAGYRLLPAAQVMFVSGTALKVGIDSLNMLYQALVINNTKKEKPNKFHEEERFLFSEQIELQNINFSYPNTNDKVINNISLSIKHNTIVAFVGSTGAGKTTIVDIILTLLCQKHGQIKVDGIEINETNQYQWQKCLGYVPQNIFLSDETIAQNIAFGVKKEEIDMEAVQNAAKVANVHNFVLNELPEGYDSVVGERGVRLSGGQRQRIGIARAMYHNPDVIILDEATSALDSITEEAVMDAIHNLLHKKTIIIIAHRLTTIKECDFIYLMEKGKILAQGSYNYLIENNSLFRQMAKVK